MGFLRQPDESKPSGEPAGPVRLNGFGPAGRRLLKRRLLTDRLARRGVTLGGLIIIGSILSILFVIVAQVLPLFKPARVRPGPSIDLPGGSPAKPLRLGIDEYRAIAYAVTAREIAFRSVDDGRAVPANGSVPDLGGARIVSVSHGAAERFALGLSDGRVVPISVEFDVRHVGERRVVTPVVRAEAAVRAHVDGREVRHVAYAEHDEGAVIATDAGPRRVGLTLISRTTSLTGETTEETSTAAIDLPREGEISVLAMDLRGEDLMVGTTSGDILRVDLRDRFAPRLSEHVVRAGIPAAPITALSFLIGDRTLAVGDERGRLTTWQLLRGGGSEFRLVRINTFTPHPGRILEIAPSRRDKGFLTLDDRGGVHLHYGTTGKTLLELNAGRGAVALGFAPKVDGFLAADDRRIHTWSLHNPHPEITWKALFGKVWYEGYDEPAYVWQSTGGTDDFEAKLSLTPLLFGTLKGTLYALIFAIPLALLGALYASQFMHPDMRQRVKPVVEIMAALPSVVLGFIAGLWLAPNMEKVLPGIFVMPVVLAGCILLALALWRTLPTGLRRKVKPGYEIVLLVPVVLLGAWLALRLGGVVEHALLRGDYRTWILDVLGLSFDQRNSVVVGFAMGFAVVPIIFTIAEDSLSSVPQHLRAASLALGATPWQTAIRVVLPTASPGIFSAIMIGLGRAIGETMIVLMATGNTPVMDLSAFSGFRAMSANIAVELPEAPDGGTLFRVLFLAALLLFALTFVMNTAAELIRLSLRKRYQYL